MPKHPSKAKQSLLLILWSIYQIGRFLTWSVIEACKFTAEVGDSATRLVYSLTQTINKYIDQYDRPIVLPSIKYTPIKKRGRPKKNKIIVSFQKLVKQIKRRWTTRPALTWPKIELPKIKIPTIALPTLVLPKLSLPKVKLPRPTLHQVKKSKRGRPAKRKGVKKYLAVSPKVRWGVLAVFLLILVSGYTIVLVTVTRDLPSPDKLSSLQTPTTTEFYDRNGELLYRLYEGRNRTLVKLDEVPQDMINATVAIEDKNFFKHQGVDVSGLARIVWVYFKDHQVQGGSTLTQQLIKNTLLSNERTWQRKAKEMVLAVWAETIYTKPQILQMYFNEAPYGGPAWGVEAAAQTYFKKSVKELDLAEIAYLAGLPASPSIYSPYGTNPELGVERQKLVLRAMLDQQYINQYQYDMASAEQLEFAPAVTSIKAPHFVMYLRQQLAEKYGDRTLSEGGFKIQTTLDLKTQQMAEEVVAEEVDKLASLNVTNGAAMVLDPKNGQILAMVGSKNYFDPKVGNFNVAIAPRQPGSSIKPITYATGFKQGYSPGNILLDTPTTFKNQWETYKPVNYDGKFHGAVSIRTSLGSSYNIPAVKMLAMVGIQNMVQTAKDMGITTFNDPSRFGLSLTLGGGEVKLIDMMGVYGTFASNGVHYEPEGVMKITDSYGNVLEDNTKPSGETKLSPGVAYLINNVLADNNARTPAFGPNSLLKIPGHTVAVKTGTTDLKRDNWTFGYTPDVVVGVWVGNNDNTPMDPRLSSGITGAAPIWNKIITNLIQDKPDVAFARPTNVIDGLVDGRRDVMIAGVSNKSAVAIRNQKPENGNDRGSLGYTDPFNGRILTPVNIP